MGQNSRVSSVVFLIDDRYGSLFCESTRTKGSEFRSFWLPFLGHNSSNRIKRRGRKESRRVAESISKKKFSAALCGTPHPQRLILPKSAFRPQLASSTWPTWPCWPLIWWSGEQPSTVAGDDSAQGGSPLWLWTLGFYSLSFRNPQSEFRLPTNSLHFSDRRQEFHNDFWPAWKGLTRRRGE